MVELRRGLDIDPGYLSRILRRFEADGLVTRERSASGGRRQIITLIPAGRATSADLDARSAEQITGLLDGIDESDRRRLGGAMGTIEEILSRAQPPTSFVLRPLAPGDLGWVVRRHGARYAEEYGWDHEFEGLVARIVADYVTNHDPRRENFWIAEVDGAPVGSICCSYRDDETAQLRLLLVEPDARGRGDRRPTGRGVPALRPPRGVRADRPVHLRSARRGAPPLPAGRLRTRPRGAGPRLRP